MSGPDRLAVYGTLAPGGSNAHVLHAPELAGHLERLDAFEGPGYRRVVTEVGLGDGRAVEAWVYVLAEARS